MAITDPRPPRLCEICWGLDDHPRHVIQGPPGFSEIPPPDSFPEGTPVDAIRQALDDSVQIHHHNCGASVGCEICTVIVNDAGGAKVTGETLLTKKLEFDDALLDGIDPKAVTIDG